MKIRVVYRENAHQTDRYACRMQFQVVNIILTSIKAQGEISLTTEGRFYFDSYYNKKICYSKDDL